METENEPENHRRFLKHYSLEYKLGTYFPEKLILQKSTEPLSFESLRHTKNGSVVFIMSATCAACHMEPIQEFVNDYRGFTYCLLFEGDKKTMNDQIEIYNFDIPFYQCEVTKLEKQLNTDIVPYVLILNKIGQVIGAGIFNNYDRLKLLADPLIKVYERSLYRI